MYVSFPDYHSAFSSSCRENLRMRPCHLCYWTPHLCTMTYEDLVPSSSLPLAGGLILISCHWHLSHLECKMSNEIAQLEVATSSKCKIATSSLFWGLQFLCGRENSVHQRSVLLSTGLQRNLLTNKFRLFVILSDRKMWPAVLAQAWGQKWGSLALHSLATDTLIDRKCCWLLENQAGTGVIIAFLAHSYWTHFCDRKFKSSRQTFSARGNGQLGTRLWNNLIVFIFSSRQNCWFWQVFQLVSELFMHGSMTFHLFIQRPNMSSNFLLLLTDPAEVTRHSPIRHRRQSGIYLHTLKCTVCPLKYYHRYTLLLWTHDI